MKNLKIYEQYLTDTPIAKGETRIEPERAPMEVEAPSAGAHFEAETEDFRSAPDNAEGNYIARFENAEGEETTIELCGASSPEFIGGSMVSNLEVVRDSSSDGKEYSAVGYFKEIPDSGKEYELKKILIEGL